MKNLQPTWLLDLVGGFLWWVVVATSGAIRVLELPPEDHNFLSIPKVAFGRLVKEIQSEAQGLQNYHWVSLNHRKIIYISSRSSIYIYIHIYIYHPSAFEENLRPTVTGQVSRRTGFSGCWRGRQRALAIHWSGYFEKSGTFQRLSDVKVAVVYVPSLGVTLCGGILPLARLFMFGLYDIWCIHISLAVEHRHVCPFHQATSKNGGIYIYQSTMQSMKLVPFRPFEPCFWGGMLEAKLPRLNHNRSIV